MRNYQAIAEIIGEADDCSVRKQTRPRNQVRPLRHCAGVIVPGESDQNVAGLLRPAAIVPNVGAIYPRNGLALDATRGALQRVVWNVDIENYLVTFDAIGHIIDHGSLPLRSRRPPPTSMVPPAIVPRNGGPDESKWQAEISDTK